MAMYVVDGNNLKSYLLGAGLLQSDDDARLVDLLRRSLGVRRGKRGKGRRVEVWFDAGTGDRRATGDASITVRVAPPGVTADEAILRELKRLPAAKDRRDAFLVTSDRELAEQARLLKVEVVDCERFAARLAPRPAKGADAAAAEKAQIARELGRAADEWFLPPGGRKARPVAKPVRVSPRKVSLLRDPSRLAELLREGDRAIRRRAALALARTGSAQAARTLERLVVTDPVPSVRAQAAVALGVMRDEPSLDALEKAATDSFSLVRAAVAVALADWDAPRATALRQRLQRDSSRRVRKAAR